MSRFLGSRLTLVGLLVSILVLVVGVSAVMGAGSRESSGASDGANPTIQASPLWTVVENCDGSASFDVYGSGWTTDDVVLITLQTDAGRLFVGAGFPGASGGFVDNVSAPVSGCGVMTVEAHGSGASANAPVSVVADKPE